MPAVNDTLGAVFLIVFGIGFLFTLVSFFLGVGHIAGFAHGHGGGVGHDGFAHGAHGHALPAHGHSVSASSDAGPVSPLNGFTIAAFMMWFGLAGFLSRMAAGAAAPLAFTIAVAGGLAAAAGVFLFLAKVIVPNQTVMDPDDFQREGTAARVTISIPSGGVGEIVYSLAGARHSDAARHATNAKAAVPRGEEVVITGFDRGVALIQPVRELLGEVGPEG
jgi:hypothetical protein